MSRPLEDLPPQAIVLKAADDSLVDGSLGSMNFRVNIGDIRTTHELVRAVSTELLFPHEASGMDALLDLMSDLDWFGHNAGYVVEFEGLDRLGRREPELLARFVTLLPYLCDRWRSRGVPFRVVLRWPQATRGVVREAIDAANAEMNQAATGPWLADLMPAEVIECD